MAESLQYLRLQVRVRADNVVRGVRMEVTPSAGGREAGVGNADAWAEVCEADNRVLLRWPMRASGECSPGRAASNDVILRARVPLRSDARKLRIVRDGVVLTELPISPDLPHAALDWVPGRGRVPGRQTVRWHSSAPAADAFLKYSVDDGRTWLRVGPRSSGSPFEIDFNQLPGGTKCRLALVVTAHCRTTTVTSEVFEVEATAPQLTVMSPLGGRKQCHGVETLLEAAVGWPHGQPQAVAPSISWRSSRDGELGTGLVLRCVLSAGKHDLTATLQGNQPVSQTFTIDVQTRNPPSQP